MEKEKEEKVEEKIEEVKLTPEEINMVSRGERPEDMDFEEFRQLRKQLKLLIKHYSKGRMMFLSKDLHKSPKGMTYYKKDFIK